MKKIKLTIVASGERTDGKFWFVGIEGEGVDKEGFLIDGQAHIFGHTENKFALGKTFDIPEERCKIAKPKGS